MVHRAAVNRAHAPAVRLVGAEAGRAWDLLLAMLVTEATFGLPGVVAASIYYAYLKQELANRRLV